MTRTEAIEREVSDIDSCAPTRRVRVRTWFFAGVLLSVLTTPWAIGLLWFTTPFVAARIAIAGSFLLVLLLAVLVGVASWLRLALRGWGAKRVRREEGLPAGARLAMD
ncbi:MAG: hypothetical protein AAGA57_05960 [Planctomycetota bacterium]